MRFNEWQDKLLKEHEKIQGVALAEIAEVMFLNGSSIVVTIGKTYQAKIDGISFSVRNLRSFYTQHKDEFANLLESMTEQAKVVSEVTETLLEAVTVDSMPELIMDRLQGQQSQDSIGVVRELAKKRLTELWEIWDRPYPTITFRIEVDVADKILTLNQNDFIGWGTLIFWGNNKAIRAESAEECLFFVSQFEIIKAKVKQVADGLMRLGKQITA